MRRRGRSPTVYQGTNTPVPEDEVMDEDDQTALVEALEKECAEQLKQFQLYFTYIVYFAIVISLVFPLLCQEECSYQMTSCWTHALYSAIVHGLSLFLARNNSQSQDLRWFVLTFLLVAIPINVWVMGAFHEDIEHFHIGLILSTMPTFGGCIMLRWDDRSTFTSINDLKRLKYEYKTL
jgi:hypothetical protein